MTLSTETFYGNDTETFYVDQFNRIWLIQSSAMLGNSPIQFTQLPDGLDEVDFPDAELNDEIFTLPESAKKEILASSEDYAQSFVDEFNEALDPMTTDWDSTAFDDCQRKYTFHLNDQETYGEAWKVFQSALVAETVRLTEAAK